MIIYVTKKTSPFYTLAMEELLLKDESIKEDIMYFYQHDNAIIIGKNQNIYEEVKLDVVEKEKLKFIVDSQVVAQFIMTSEI